VEAHVRLAVSMPLTVMAFDDSMKLKFKVRSRVLSSETQTCRTPHPVDHASMRG